ncbi:MAG: ATP-binding cassette domain-containing protein [Candidatus Accumulibacter sp.]|nr:ATP-binding cassette domain-containing protein [Accumulibacter sp.]
MLRLDQLATRHVGPLSLTIAAGECVCVQGASGSGKSLLLRAIADLDPHDGEIYLNDLACSAQPAARWRASVTLLMAESQWWAERVGEHFPVGVDPAWLDGLALPKDALDWTVARCSTGERQRLALLRALMGQPAVLLLDEPTGNLDEQSARLVESLLADYRRCRQATLLWISHDERQAARIASRRFLLSDGQLTALPQ